MAVVQPHVYQLNHVGSKPPTFYFPFLQEIESSLLLRSALPMKHNVILVVLDGLNAEVAQHAMGHLQAYVGAGRANLYKLECELPSLSRPLYECILTGVPPIQSGIVHNNVSRACPTSAAFPITPPTRGLPPQRRLTTGSASCITARLSRRPGSSHRRQGAGDPARAFLLE